MAVDFPMCCMHGMLAIAQRCHLPVMVACHNASSVCCFVCIMCCVCMLITAAAL
jgi:hypothetical protein